MNPNPKINGYLDLYSCYSIELEAEQIGSSRWNDTCLRIFGKEQWLWIKKL